MRNCTCGQHRAQQQVADLKAALENVEKQEGSR